MKKVLGRGLDSLIPVAEEEKPVTAGVIEIDISLIDPNKNQPRKVFREKGLEELSESIAVHGVVQPLLVNKKGDRYVIIAGERRFRAAKMAGVKQVPVVVKDYSPQQIVEVALIENIQREDLNPIEEANAYHALMMDFSLTQEALAQRVGKSRPAVANALRLLSLPEQILAMVEAQTLSAGHARALLGVEDAALQLRLAEQIVKNGLSVRDTEKLIAGQKTAPKRKLKTVKSPELNELENNMKRFFGTKVKISGSLTRGKIEIEYFNRDDIERIYELISTFEK